MQASCGDHPCICFPLDFSPQTIIISGVQEQEGTIRNIAEEQTFPSFSF
jgi:hypothetical protein